MTPGLQHGIPARALRWIAAAAILCSSLGAFAPTARALDVPPLHARVNDYAKLLPPDRAAALEARLAAHEQRTQQQFALLTLPSLQGDYIEDFSIRVADAWKLGNKGTDQGLIMIVVPAERRARIEVGYGLEGAIPDAIAARVIREVLAPAFLQQDYAGGIDAAFGALMHASGGEGTPLPERPESRRGRRSFPGSWILFAVFILLPLLSRFFGGRRGPPGLRGRGGVVPPIFWGGGGWGGGGGGGWGGGGGGFSGGGGGFGGGGASGGW